MSQNTEENDPKRPYKFDYLQSLSFTSLVENCYGDSKWDAENNSQLFHCETCKSWQNGTSKSNLYWKSKR